MLERFTWYVQSAYRWEGDGLRVYIDPYRLTTEDPADVIFITHAHWDHFDQDDIAKVRTGHTTVVAPRDVANALAGNVRAVSPGDSLEVSGVKVEVVAAYNVVEERLQAHPRANNWVGYVLDLGGTTYYHAGDTDHTAEAAEVRAAVTFLPIGGTYTMDAPEAAGLARVIRPQLAVPMHYGLAVGTPADAETFRKLADPIPVEILTPENPFERT